MEKEIRIYITSNGKQPFNEWLAEIKDNTTEARIKRRLDRLSLGHYGDVKSLGDGISELRLQFGSGYRIYFGEIDNKIVLLLCAGDKSTQSRDIQKAKEYWQKFTTGMKQ
jgi:putative addiction module killer protein